MAVAGWLRVRGDLVTMNGSPTGGARRPDSFGTVSVGRPLASVLGWVGAATCALIGIAHAQEPQFEGAGEFLATLAGLGALALAAVSLWQAVTSDGARTVLLILLAVLAAGFVATNALALLADFSGVPRVPRTLHLVGAISGSALYLETIVDVSVFLPLRTERKE